MPLQCELAARAAAAPGPSGPAVARAAASGMCVGGDHTPLGLLQLWLHAWGQRGMLHHSMYCMGGCVRKTSGWAAQTQTLGFLRNCSRRARKTLVDANKILIGFCFSQTFPTQTISFFTVQAHRTRTQGAARQPPLPSPTRPIRGRPAAPPCMRAQDRAQQCIGCAS